MRIFIFNILIILVLFILFGFDYKIIMKEPVVSRRTVVLACDLSASTGFKFDNIKKEFSEVWPEYNLIIIPFSDKIKGTQDAGSTALVESTYGIIKYISQKFIPEDIATLIILSDGNETENEKLLFKKSQPKTAYPINIWYLNSKKQDISFDKSISFVKVPRFVPIFKKESITFDVSVIGSSLKAVPVKIKLNGKNLGAVRVALNENGYGQGKLDLIIKKPGQTLLEAYVALDSREKLKENNTDYAIVEGIMKGYRVLHISGHPSVDTAFVRRGLQNIPGVDMISFFILRTNRQLGVTAQDELSLIHFPTDQLFRQELDNFDLIIMNDFSLTKFLKPLYIDNIAKFVSSGGGLLLMGGAQSFQEKDFLSNNFDSILPILPSPVGNWLEKRYSLKDETSKFMTPLRDIRIDKNIRFQGLNKLALKKWANVFVRTSADEPFMVGGIVDKGRVLLILSDAYWRVSYNGNIPNDMALKPLIRYVLGLSFKPVHIRENQITFSNIHNQNDKNIRAKLIFKDFTGNIKKEKIIQLSESYPFKDTDTKLIEVRIENIKNPNSPVLIDSYSLINQMENIGKEFLHVPAGRKFLKRIAEQSDGNFIETNGQNLKDLANQIEIKEEMSIMERRVSNKPIYMHKGILIIFLYLGISSFYLKSRFAYLG